MRPARLYTQNCLLNLPQYLGCRKSARLRPFCAQRLKIVSAFTKKCRRAVNSLDGTCGMLGTTCVVTGTVGFWYRVCGGAGTRNRYRRCRTARHRRCSAKAAKHKAVCVLASAKLNTVHSHITKALEDCNICDDEYKLVLEEIEKYRTIKEIRRKHFSAAGSMIDDEIKKRAHSEKKRRDAIHLHKKAGRFRFSVIPSMLCRCSTGCKSLFGFISSVLCMQKDHAGAP